MMKILMIGNKSSGKTTYMMSSYGHLQKNITGGFTIQTTEDSNHYFFVNQYINIKIEGRYPLATMKRNSYDFNLFYNRKNVHSFQWNDFNGGIIDERVTENSSILKNDMANSDGLMLFFDAVELKNDTLETRVRQIIRLISQNLKSIERPYYVSIIITKADLVHIKSIEDLECINTPIIPLINILNANDAISYQCIPVCCTKEKFVNVDYPILYMLYGGMYNHCGNIINGLDAEYEKLTNYQNNTNWIDDIYSFLADKISYRDLAQKKANEITPKIQYFEKIKQSLDELVDYLNSRDLFKGFSDRNNKYSF